jgi:hypothetical protein
MVVKTDLLRLRNPKLEMEFSAAFILYLNKNIFIAESLPWKWDVHVQQPKWTQPPVTSDNLMHQVAMVLLYNIMLIL